VVARRSHGSRPSPSGEAPSGLTATAARGYGRAVDLLDRLVPLAHRVHRGVFRFAMVVAACAAAIAATFLVLDLPGTGWTWGLWAALVVVLAAAPVVLLLFSRMLGEALALPARLRNLPEVGPAHAAELSRLAAEAARREPGTRLRSLPRDGWRAGRLLLRAHDDVPYVGALLSIVRVPFLIAVGVASVAGLATVAVTPLVLVGAAVTAAVT
jgi:hypothetical protein